MLLNTPASSSINQEALKPTAAVGLSLKLIALTSELKPFHTLTPPTVAWYLALIKSLRSGFLCFLNSVLVLIKFELSTTMFIVF